MPLIGQGPSLSPASGLIRAPAPEAPGPIAARPPCGRGIPYPPGGNRGTRDDAGRDHVRAFGAWLALLGVGGLVTLGAFGLTGRLTGSGPLSAGVAIVTALGALTLANRWGWLGPAHPPGGRGPTQEGVEVSRYGRSVRIAHEAWAAESACRQIGIRLAWRLQHRRSRLLRRLFTPLDQEGGQ